MTLALMVVLVVLALVNWAITVFDAHAKVLNVAGAVAATIGIVYLAAW